MIDQGEHDVDIALAGHLQQGIEPVSFVLAGVVVAQAGIGPLDAKAPGGHPHANPVAACRVQRVEPVHIIHHAAGAVPRHIFTDGEIGRAVVEDQVARAARIAPDKPARLRLGDGEALGWAAHRAAGDGGRQHAVGPLAHLVGREADQPGALAHRRHPVTRTVEVHLEILIVETGDNHAAARRAGEARIEPDVGGIVGVAVVGIERDFDLELFVAPDRIGTWDHRGDPTYHAPRFRLLCSRSLRS